MPAAAGTAQQFQFTYNVANGWGNLNSITYPSGLAVHYSYLRDNSAIGVGSFFLTNPVVRKEEDYLDVQDGASIPRANVWTFSYETGAFSARACNSMTSPDMGVDTVCVSQLVPTSEAFTGTIVKETNPIGQITEKRFAVNPLPWASITNTGNIYPSMEVKVLPGNNPVAAVTVHTVDANGNDTQTRTYDWVPYSSISHDANGQPSGLPSGNLLNIDSKTYLNGALPGSGNDDAAAYWNPSSSILRSLVSSRTIAGPSGPGSLTTLSYDARGNVLTRLNWDSSKAATAPAILDSNSAIRTTRTYSNHGNILTSTNGRGVQTQYTWDANDLYLTKRATAVGATEGRTTTFSFDPASGLLQSLTDVDNNVTSTFAYDALDRLMLTQEAVGTPVQRNTRYMYEDDSRLRVIVQKDLDASRSLVTVTDYDQLGRIRLTRQLESGNQSADDDNAGIKVQTRTLTSGALTYMLVSNPFRAATSGAAAQESGMGWTLTTMDQGQRVQSVQSFDGSALPAPWGNNGSTSGTVQTVYDGPATTVTDQTGNSRSTMINALSKLSAAIEDPGSLNLITSYSYDALGNLTQVSQGAQTRTYSYDSLSRLIRATNPESGSILWKYDNNSNPVQRTDARSSITTYTYDFVDRLVQKAYSNDKASIPFTPQINYGYDKAGANFHRASDFGGGSWRFENRLHLIRSTRPFRFELSDDCRWDLSFLLFV